MRHSLSKRDKSEATDPKFPHANRAFPLDNTISLRCTSGCTRRTCASTRRPFGHALDIDLRRVRRQGGEHGRFTLHLFSKKKSRTGLTRVLPPSTGAARLALLAAGWSGARQVASPPAALARLPAAGSAPRAPSLLPAALQPPPQPRVASLAAMAAVAPDLNTTHVQVLAS